MGSKEVGHNFFKSEYDEDWGSIKQQQGNLEADYYIFYKEAR